MKPYPARLQVTINHWRELFGGGERDTFTESLRFVGNPNYRGSAAGTKEWKRYRRYVRKMRALYQRLNDRWPSLYQEVAP